MRRKILLILSGFMVSVSFVGCGAQDGTKGAVRPEYFEIEANRDIDSEGFESISTKIYDINNDGILEELDLAKKEKEKYIFIMKAETREMKGAIKVSEDSSTIEKIYDEDSDGVEEIFVGKENGKQGIYKYSSKIKGYEEQIK